MSTITLTARTFTDIAISIAGITGKSFWKTASTFIRPRPGNGEDRLHEEGADQQAAPGEADDRDDRYHRRRDGVHDEHRTFGQALGAGNADEVLAQHLEQARAHEARQQHRRADAENEARQHHGFDVKPEVMFGRHVARCGTTGRTTASR